MFRRLSLTVALLGLAAVGGARELTSAYVVTAVANTVGVAGTDWHSDLTLYNPHTFDLPVVIHFLPTGKSNLGGAPTVELELGPWETVNLWDILGPDGFAARGTTGALLLYADDTKIACSGTDCDFAVFARTYTLDPAGGIGEFGQAVPGFPGSLGLDATVMCYLPQLMESADFRTNLGVASWTSDWVKVRVEVQDASGNVVDTSDHLVPPFGHIQWHFGHSVVGGTAAVWIVDGPSGAMVYPYASVVNNTTGDAVNIEAFLSPVGISAQAASRARGASVHRPVPPGVPVLLHVSGGGERRPTAPGAPR